MKRAATPLYKTPDIFRQLLEIGQDPTLTHKEIMKRIPSITRSQIQWATLKGQIPNRSKEALIKKLIEVGKDPNLSYKEIMERVPVTYSQIRHATEKGLIPKRCFDPEKLYNFRSIGGINGSATRWGVNDSW